MAFNKIDQNLNLIRNQIKAPFGQTLCITVILSLLMVCTVQFCTAQSVLDCFMVDTTARLYRISDTNVQNCSSDET